jgi:hypothetical protein
MQARCPSEAQGLFFILPPLIRCIRVVQWLLWEMFFQQIFNERNWTFGRIHDGHVIRRLSPPLIIQSTKLPERCPFSLSNVADFVYKLKILDEQCRKLAIIIRLPRRMETWTTTAVMETINQHNHHSAGKRSYYLNTFVLKHRKQSVETQANDYLSPFENVN